MYMYVSVCVYVMRGFCFHREAQTQYAPCMYLQTYSVLVFRPLLPMFVITCFQININARIQVTKLQFICTNQQNVQITKIHTLIYSNPNIIDVKSL